MPVGYDKTIHACVIALMLFGSIMVVSTSVGDSINDSSIVVKTLFKQIVFVVLSYFSMCKIAVNFFKWKRKKNFDQIFFLLGFVIFGMLLATLFFPGANGAKRWIYLGRLGTIQPSEFAKSYLIILMGLTANHFANKRVDLIQYIKRPLLFLVLFLAAVSIQPDLGTFIAIGIIFAVCFIIPSHGNLVPAQKLVKVGLVLFFALIAFSMTDAGINVMESVFGGGFRFRRFIDAANPFENVFGSGYNLVYSLYAIANGGISGLGIGGSKEKFGYLPEAETDFIFSVTIEELGIFGLLFIVICYGLILYRLFYYAKRTKSDGYRVILVGCAIYLATHFILNVGGVSGLLPLTGIPLLMISAGGSSLLAVAMLFGVCQAVIAMSKNQAKRSEEKRLPF